MKAIFLDFNGVLDTYENMNVVDSENLAILKNIIEITKAKIVISSSIKNSYYYAGKHNRVMEMLSKVLEENEIEIYGITPYLENRELEIKEYLKMHPEITQFCIIDDDYFFESMKEQMIKLKSQLSGGNGLKEISKNEIVSKLNKNEDDVR